MISDIPFRVYTRIPLDTCIIRKALSDNVCPGFDELLVKHRSAVSGGFLLCMLMSIDEKNSFGDIDVYCTVDDYIHGWGETLISLGYRPKHPTRYGNGTSSVKWTPDDRHRVPLDFHIIVKGECSVYPEFRQAIIRDDDVGDEIFKEIISFDFSCCMNMYFMGKVYSPFYEMTRRRQAYYFPECKGTSDERLRKYKKRGFEFIEII